MPRIDLDLGGTGLVVDEEDLLEGLASVGSAEETALFVRAVGMSGDGDVDAVGVLRVDGDLTDLLAVAQAQMRPGLAL
jgi:hypothetical protein